MTAVWDVSDIASWSNGESRDLSIIFDLDGDTIQSASARTVTATLKMRRDAPPDLSWTVPGLSETASGSDLSGTSVDMIRVSWQMSLSLSQIGTAGLSASGLSETRVRAESGWQSVTLDVSSSGGAVRTLPFRLKIQSDRVQAYLGDVSLPAGVSNTAAYVPVLSFSGLDPVDMSVDPSSPPVAYLKTLSESGVKIRTARTRNVPSVDDSGVRLDKYIYDNAYRLTKVARNGADYLAYTYDADGNVTGRWSASDNTARVFSRDALGRITRAGIFPNVSDPASMPSLNAASAPDYVDYTYRLDGWQRASRDASWDVSGAVRFVYDGNNAAYEFADGALADHLKTVSARLMPGLDDVTMQMRRVGASGSLTTEYLSTGGTGHVGLVIDPSRAAGSRVVEKYRYDAFGGREIFDASHSSWFTPDMGVPSDPLQESSATRPASLLGFQGRRHDVGLGGVMYFRNRQYDPETGIFLSTDPAGIPDGPNS